MRGTVRGDGVWGVVHVLCGVRGDRFSLRIGQCLLTSVQLERVGGLGSCDSVPASWKAGRSAGNSSRVFRLGFGRFRLLGRRRRLEALDSEKLMRLCCFFVEYDVNLGLKQRSGRARLRGIAGQ